MKSWQTIKRWLCGGCVYYTGLSFLLIFIRLLIGGTEDAGRIYTVSFLLLFPCGLCLSFAGMLLRCNRLPRWSRYLLHYVITVVSIFLFVSFGTNTTVQPVNILLLWVLFTVLYWLLFGLGKLIQGRVRRLMEEY